MARPLRIEYPGAIYHVLSRGDRRKGNLSGLRLIEKLFLDLFSETCGRTGWQIHAYCLMDNHFHLVVEAPRSNLSAGFPITVQAAGVGRGCGVGRGLGVTVRTGVPDGVAVGVGVAVGLGVGVSVGVGVGVGAELSSQVSLKFPLLF